MTILRRLLKYLTPYRGRTTAALLAMALVSLSTGALVFFFRSLFDDVLIPSARGVSTSPDFASGIGASRHTALLAWADRSYASLKLAFLAHGVELKLAVPILLLASLVAKNIFSYLSEYEFNGVGLSVVRDLRSDAYEKLLRQPASFFTSSTTGDLMSRLLGDVELIQAAFGTRIADLFQGVLTIAVMLGYVIALNPTLSFFALVVAPILVWPIVEISRRLRRTVYTSRERMGSIGEILQETIRGHRIVKTYGMEGFESERFRDANQKYFKVNLKTLRIQALSSPLMEILSGTGLIALFVYAAGQISAGRMKPGDLLSFLIALLTMYAPLKAITKVNLSLQQAISAASRIFDVMDRASEVPEIEGAPALAPIRDSIRFENISFSYGEAEVLRDVSFEVRRGETLALVGPSGAGKTSLVNLLPRLYDPREGRILIDGVDIRQVSLSSLRSQMALVTQETILFNGSARSNIAYGRAGASEQSVVAAARAARADGFLRELPDGYDTSVGENAGRLSGGQRQRLSIARAFFKNAPILILDEATSQLDSESEAAVAEALATLMLGKTTLVIAHRLSTVRRADRILVLEAGRVAESGSHAELLARGGLYRRLHDMQYFGSGGKEEVVPA